MRIHVSECLRVDDPGMKGAPVPETTLEELAWGFALVASRAVASQVGDAGEFAAILAWSRRVHSSTHPPTFYRSTNRGSRAEVTHVSLIYTKQAVVREGEPYRRV